MTNQEIKAEYLENEDCNDHAANYVLLAKHFGTEAQQELAQRNYDWRELVGYTNPELSAETHAAVNPLYSNVRAA